MYRYIYIYIFTILKTHKKKIAWKNKNNIILNIQGSYKTNHIVKWTNISYKSCDPSSDEMWFCYIYTYSNFEVTEHENVENKMIYIHK